MTLSRDGHVLALILMDWPIISPKSSANWAVLTLLDKEGRVLGVQSIATQWIKMYGVLQSTKLLFPLKYDFACMAVFSLAMAT